MVWNGTRKGGRGLLYLAIPRVGGAGTASSVDSDGLNDIKFSNYSGGRGDFNKAQIYRPDTPAVDRLRAAGMISGTKLKQTGLAYADAGASTTTLAYELLYLLEAFVINECFRDALFETYLDYYWPVDWTLDNDFASAFLTVADGSPWDWTANAVTCTPAKVATAGQSGTQAGQTGPRNLRLTNTSADGYVKTSRLYLSGQGNEQIAWGAYARVNGDYTGRAQLWDVTNNVELEHIDFTARSFQRVFTTTAAPEGCYIVEKRYGAVENGAVTEWDCGLGHIVGTKNFDLPDHLVEQFQFLDFLAASYSQSTGQKLHNAASRDLRSWYEELDYQFQPTYDDASPRFLQIHRRGGLPSTDMWVHLRRPWSSIDEVLTEADLTLCGERYFMPNFIYLVLEKLCTTFSRDGWEPTRDRYKKERDGQRLVRVPKKAPAEDYEYTPGGRRGSR